MKNTPANLSKTFFPFIILILLTAPLFSQAVKKPENKEASPDESQTAKKTKSGADQYKFVFAESYQGRMVSVDTEGIHRQRHWRLDDFIERLNAASAEGYRLVSVTNGWNPVAVLKADEGAYEYGWFETVGGVFFAHNGLEERLAELAEKGGRIVKHIYIYKDCKYMIENDPASEICRYTDLFIAEKPKGAKSRFENVLLTSGPGWGRKPSEEFEQQIAERLADGFYPTNAFSGFEILLSRARDAEETSSEKTEVRVVRGSMGRGGVEGKVNALAKTGYRIGVMHNGIAVLYRRAETAADPVSYIWLRADNRDFEKKLARLQQNGAAYFTTFPTDQGLSKSLVFQQKLKDDGARSEFKILKYDFDYREPLGENKVYQSLKPASQNIANELNKLAAEGFVVRDLFDFGGIILERRK